MLKSVETWTYLVDSEFVHAELTLTDRLGWCMNAENFFSVFYVA